MTGLRFDQPAFLLLALLAIPLAVLGWRALAGLSAARRIASIFLRTVLLIGLAIVLAGPHTVRTHDALTVIGVLDVSGSVRRFADLPPVPDLGRRSNLEYLRHWFREATDTRAPDDRFGLVVFDGEAIAVSAPVAADLPDVNLDVSQAEGTNIEAAIRLAMAMFPADTARRLVLVTDGVETTGNAIEAAREAAAGSAVALAEGPGAGVPIDIVPVTYRIEGDVQVLAVETPAAAQPNQTVTARIILEATQPTVGTLTLRREGRPVDLNGPESGTGRRIEIPAGRSVHLAQVELDDSPVNRFDAAFEPASAEADALPDNNVAEAFTATPSRGSVLILTSASEAPAPSHPLAAVLDAADIPVTVQPPAAFPADLLALQRYDLIVIDDVPAFDLLPAQHELLAHYVNDLGGGLVMLGGENAFGAGGWTGTAVEDVLPVRLDPPRELRLPTAALVLVLDKSGSMNAPVPGARATQQQVANEGAALAIESLRPESLVAVITFDSWARVHIPLQRNDEPAKLAERVRAIGADGGTNVVPALQAAHEMLRELDVDRKRVVLLSDGRSADTDVEPLVQGMVASGIRISTIAVGADADRELLSTIADLGDGDFYAVHNPNVLPRVLVDSVQIVNKPLIKEGRFQPQVLPTGSALTAGMTAAPPLEGLVITAPREDPLAVVEMVHPDGEPLLAQWQAGLGRVAAFTSSLDEPWGEAWSDWPTAAAFWTQLVRTTARPPTNRQAELVARVEDGRLQLVLEAVDEQGVSMDHLQVPGTVYGPDGQAMDVRLEQTGPGRYEGSVRADDAGNYIVALSPRRGTRRLPPVIGGATQNTSPEFRRYESDLALLEEIASITGGRRLDVREPEAATLFDRSDMEPTVSLLPSWRPLLLAVIALLLLDVACRRIAWSGEAIQRALARAVERVMPGERGEASAATLASLRRASAQVESRTGPKARGEAAPARTRASEPVARRMPRRQVNEPTPSRVNAALDLLRGRRSGTTAPPSSEAEGTDATAKAAADAAKPEPPDNTGSSPTTSGLLAAKRRATERLREAREDHEGRDDGSST